MYKRCCDQFRIQINPGIRRGGRRNGQTTTNMAIWRERKRDRYDGVHQNAHAGVNKCPVAVRARDMCMCVCCRRLMYASRTLSCPVTQSLRPDAASPSCSTHLKSNKYTINIYTLSCPFISRIEKIVRHLMLALASSLFDFSTFRPLLCCVAF